MSALACLLCYDCEPRLSFRVSEVCRADRTDGNKPGVRPREHISPSVAWRFGLMSVFSRAGFEAEENANCSYENNQPFAWVVKVDAFPEADSHLNLTSKGFLPPELSPFCQTRGTITSRFTMIVDLSRVEHFTQAY